MTLDAFSQLQLEAERTLFMLYGYREASGELGRGYFKLANSLSEALADLVNNPDVADEGGYLVRDVILAFDNDGSPLLHVQLTPLQEIAESASDVGGDDDAS